MANNKQIGLEFNIAVSNRSLDDFSKQVGRGLSDAFKAGPFANTLGKVISDSMKSAFGTASPEFNRTLDKIHQNEAKFNESERKKDEYSSDRIIKKEGKWYRNKLNFERSIIKAQDDVNKIRSDLSKSDQKLVDKELSNLKLQKSTMEQYVKKLNELESKTSLGAKLQYGQTKESLKTLENISKQSLGLISKKIAGAGATDFTMESLAARKAAAGASGPGLMSYLTLPGLNLTGAGVSRAIGGLTSGVGNIFGRIMAAPILGPLLGGVGLLGGGALKLGGAMLGGGANMLGRLGFMRYLIPSVAAIALLAKLKESITEVDKMRDALGQLGGGVADTSKVFMAASDAAFRYGISLDEAKDAALALWKSSALTDQAVNSLIRLKRIGIDIVQLGLADEFAAMSKAMQRTGLSSGFADRRIESVITTLGTIKDKGLANTVLQETFKIFEGMGGATLDRAIKKNAEFAALFDSFGRTAGLTEESIAGMVNTLLSTQKEGLYDVASPFIQLLGISPVQLRMAEFGVNDLFISIRKRARDFVSDAGGDLFKARMQMQSIGFDESQIRTMLAIGQLTDEQFKTYVKQSDEKIKREKFEVELQKDRQKILAAFVVPFQAMGMVIERFFFASLNKAAPVLERITTHLKKFFGGSMEIFQASDAWKNMTSVLKEMAETIETTLFSSENLEKFKNFLTVSLPAGLRTLNKFIKSDKEGGLSHWLNNKLPAITTGVVDIVTSLPTLINGLKEIVLMMADALSMFGVELGPGIAQELAKRKAAQTNIELMRERAEAALAAGAPGSSTAIATTKPGAGTPFSPGKDIYPSTLSPYQTAALASLQPNMRDRVENLLSDAAGRGYQFRINYGYRDSLTQKKFFDKWMAAKKLHPGLSPKEITKLTGVYPALPPGLSYHQMGLAVDIGGPDKEKIGALAGSHGLVWLPNDPVHFQMAGIPITPPKSAVLREELKAGFGGGDITPSIISPTERSVVSPVVEARIVNDEAHLRRLDEMISLLSRIASSSDRSANLHAKRADSEPSRASRKINETNMEIAKILTGNS